MIDLRSDTATRPSPGMRAAIAAAEVGDEQKREDPSVTALQERVAALLGQQAALFLPTATMANQSPSSSTPAPATSCSPEESSHVLIYEYGGAAVHAGLVTLGLPGVNGLLTAEQVLSAAEPSTKVADQRVALLSLEDTHNSSGGRVWPLEALDVVVGAARDAELAVHLDGARLLNAAVAQEVEAAAIASRFDTVTICLSKGLGCPLGAVLAGSADAIERAWREKHLFGGAMRQAGIVASAGLYALDHNVARLADDHARALTLAGAWAASGVPVDLEQVQTNFVQIDVSRLGLGRDEALVRMKEAGVGLSSTIHPTVVRAVTHLDVGDEDIERASELVPRALGALAAV